MIGVIFELGTEIIEFRVDGSNINFRSSAFGNHFYPLEALHFDRDGVEKEFPDLVGDDLWKQKAIERFKEKMHKLGSENKIVDYLIKDLKKYGYIAKYKQKQGFRVEAIDA